MLKKKKKQKQEQKKHFSIAFLLAIPCNFFLGTLCLITFLDLFDKSEFDLRRLAFGLIGFAAAVLLLVSSVWPRIRVLIHELKHAAMVILTGNTMKDLQIREDGGHVSYEMPVTKKQFGPTITLAPYYFPLFSLPVLVAAIIFENFGRNELAMCLGFALGIDLTTSLGEIHPAQTDFQEIVGGFFISAFYLGAFIFFWIFLCLLWIASGREAYLNTFYLGVRVLSEILL